MGQNNGSDGNNKVAEKLVSRIMYFIFFNIISNILSFFLASAGNKEFHFWVLNIVAFGLKVY